jgi:hypothetical protein
MGLIEKVKRLFKSEKYSNTSSIIRRVKLSKIYNKRIDVIYTDENIDFEKLKEFYK